MKFVPTDDYTYWWPITVKIPHPDKTGKWTTESFAMQFVAVDQDDAIALGKELSELKTDEERHQRQHDSLLAACRDWRDVIDADGKPIPFSRDVLLQMLKAAPWYRSGIYESYARSLMSDEARRGN